jgi:hypothetical protein
VRRSGTLADSGTNLLVKTLDGAADVIGNTTDITVNLTKVGALQTGEWVIKAEARSKHAEAQAQQQSLRTELEMAKEAASYRLEFDAFEASQSA